jgi:hypothetical protein
VGLRAFSAAVLWAVIGLAAVGCASVVLPDGPGRDLYAAKCHSCHRLRDPARIDQQRWPAILDKMAEKAKLTPEEEETIRRYVEAASSK